MRSECYYFSHFFSYRFIPIWQYKDLLLFNNGASLRFKGDNKFKNVINDNYMYTPVDILYNHFI